MSPLDIQSLARELRGDAEPDTRVWAAIEASSQDALELLFDELKADLDGLVRSNPPAAEVLSARIERLSRTVPSRRALGLRSRAMGQHVNGQTARAADNYGEAVRLYEAAGDELEAARVRRSLVDVRQMLGDSVGALTEADRARAVFLRRGEHRLLAQLECNVGNVFFRLDRYAEAAERYTIAIERFESADDQLGRAFALYNLGNVQTNANEFDAADASFRDAEATFASADHAVLAAESRYGRAYLSFRRGEYAQADERLRASRSEFEAIGRTGGPALCDMDLAELHLRLDAWRDALARADAAAGQFEALGMRYEQSRSLLFAGVAHARMDATVEAERALKAAGQGFEELGNRALGALVAIHRAKLHRDPEQLRPLIATVERAREDLRQSGDQFLADLGELALARVLVRVGDLVPARDALERMLARQGGRQSLQTLIEIEAWTVLAEIHRLTGAADEEESALEHAIDAGEDAFARLSVGDARLAFFRERQPAVTRLVAARLARLGSSYARKAVERLDDSRQRSLDEADAVRFPSTPELRAARARLDALLGQQLDQVVGGRPDPSATATRGPAALDHGVLRAAQDDLMRLIRAERGPAAGLAAARPASDASALDAVPKDDVLLYYVLEGDHALVVFGAPGDGAPLESRRLGCSAGELAELAAKFRLQVSKLRLGRDYLERHRGAIERSLRSLLDRLGSWTLEPAVEVLDGRPVTIVPQGVLHELPLHAATVAGAPLIARADVSVSRSLRQLGLLRRERSVDGPWRACFSPEATLPAIARERAALEEILTHRLRAGAPDELIHELTGGDPLAVRALHLASHGAYQPDHPLFSGLRLGDRFLSALDLRGAQLNCEVVTLSGCETGRMGRSRSDELHGPEQAFLAAGARAVVSSLWSVVDAHSAEFMAALYRELANGATARSAYSAALRERIAGAEVQAWAPFVLAGDPDAAPTA